MNTAKIGEPAPDFALPDMQGTRHRLRDYRDRIVIITFWSAECPISAIYDPYFNEKQSEYAAHGTQLLAIDSNSGYDEVQIKRVMEERAITFPLLRDAGNKVADLYGAQTTPHIYIVDEEGILRYMGAVDDRTFRKRTPEVNYLEKALTALWSGENPDPAETQPYGCTIVRADEGEY